MNFVINILNSSQNNHLIPKLNQKKLNNHPDICCKLNNINDFQCALNSFFFKYSFNQI